MKTDLEKKAYRKKYYELNKARLQALGRDYHRKKYVKKYNFKGSKIIRSKIEYGHFILIFD